MKLHDCIERNPALMLGKPVIKGTRITVEHVLRELGAGTTEAELLQEHPRLRAEHLRAAMLYASAVMSVRYGLRRRRGRGGLPWIAAG